MHNYQTIRPMEREHGMITDYLQHDETQCLNCNDFQTSKFVFVIMGITKQHFHQELNGSTGNNGKSEEITWVMSALYRGMLWEIRLQVWKKENPQTSSVSGQNCWVANATKAGVNAKKKHLETSISLEVLNVHQASVLSVLALEFEKV